MTGFKDSILKGLAAHEKSVRASEEIESVVAELNDEILRVTDELVGVRVRSFIEGGTALGALASSLEALTVGASGPKRYDALAVYAQGVSNSDEKIARWEKSPEGYPVTIRSSGQKWDCFDRKSLITALQALVSTSEVGENIMLAKRMAERAKQK